MGDRMTGRRNRRLANLSLIGVAVVFGAAFLLLPGLTSARSSTPPRSQAAFSKAYLDRKVLVAGSDNVFFAKVVSLQGAESPDDLPEIQYRVEVEETLKGTIAGEQTVNTFDDRPSMRTASGEVEGPLEVGHTYLFVTKFHPNGTWHTASLTIIRLKVESPSHRDELRRSFLLATGTTIQGA